MKRFIKLFIAVAICSFCESSGFQCLAQNAGETEVGNDMMEEIARRKAEKQAKEQADFDAACDAMTVGALENFIREYNVPNKNTGKINSETARKVAEAKNRIEDIKLWNQAKAQNTIAAYEKYIHDSKMHFYVKNANEGINAINAEKSWADVKNTNSVADLRNYLAQYPKSPYKAQADRRLAMLRGVEYAQGRKYDEAYSQFSLAGGRDAIDSEYRGLYDKAVEYGEYKKAVDSYSLPTLIVFLEDHPQSEYASEVSNRIARMLSNDLTMYSSEYEFNRALSYAKDGLTKNYVESRISSCKKELSDYKAQERKIRLKEKGWYTFKFGWEFMDFGFSATGDPGIIYYNMGFGVKYGGYQTPFQVELSVKPGIVAPTENFSGSNTSNRYYARKYSGGTRSWYDDDDDDSKEYYFHLPVMLRLKANICRAGSSYFYATAMAQCNAVRYTFAESLMSLGGGLGFAWSGFDMYFYYRSEVGEVKWGEAHQCVGMSLNYYF